MKYYYFTIVAKKNDEEIVFKVRGTSHIQHIWNETFINDISRNGQRKIDNYKKDGYHVYAIINDRMVMVLN